MYCRHQKEQGCRLVQSNSTALSPSYQALRQKERVAEMIIKARLKVEGGRWKIWSNTLVVLHMASLTPGTGGTLKSTSIEGGFHEALSLAALAEQDPLKNPQNLRRIGMVLDLRLSEVSGSFTFEVTPTASTDGATLFPVVEHLTGTGYVKGSGGSLKSAGLDAAIVELAELLQTKQRTLTKNPTGGIMIRKLTYNSEAKFVSCFFSYKIIGSVPSGLLSVAKVYLLD